MTGFKIPNGQRWYHHAKRDQKADEELWKDRIEERLIPAPDKIQNHFEWAESQSVFPPKFLRCADWKEELERTFDKWSTKPYESSRTCCFIFVLDCLDAMLGTDLRAMHYGGWVGAAAFGEYITRQGGLDWFDRVGMRCTDKEAGPGDLCQFEIIYDCGPAGRFLHFHWGICTDTRFLCVGFGAGGVCTFNTIKETMKYGGAIKCWKIG
ncbi:MAG: hypothetical protein AAFS13_09080 [Pseudomonadota bacterium]